MSAETVRTADINNLGAIHRCGIALDIDAGETISGAGSGGGGVMGKYNAI